MFKKLFYTFIFIFTFNISYANCTSKEGELESFIQNSIGKIISISHVKLTKEDQQERISNILLSCINTEKVAKRVLGRAKWEEMTQKEQQNFLNEYPKYLLYSFSDILLAAFSNIQDYRFRQGSNSNTIDLNLIAADSKNNINATIITEIDEGVIKIADGTFAGVSFIASQRQFFNIMHEKDSNSIKKFKASNYISK